MRATSVITFNTHPQQGCYPQKATLYLYILLIYMEPGGLGLVQYFRKTNNCSLSSPMQNLVGPGCRQQESEPKG